MSLFSKVMMCCNLCAKPFLTTFNSYDGRFCTKECFDEYKFRRATCILGIEDEKMQKPYISPTIEETS